MARVDLEEVASELRPEGGDRATMRASGERCCRPVERENDGGMAGRSSSHNMHMFIN